MTEAASTIPAQQAADAFSKQAPLFDGLYSADSIIQYKRKRVREHVLARLQPASSILELNAGTGEDAIYFAEKGHRVHATDISTAMLDVLRSKSAASGAHDRVSTECCSFTALDRLNNKGPYDFVFSNFAGLNCTAELDKVLTSLEPLVKARGLVTLVILPRFCLWELALAVKGKFRTAFRRFSGSKGAKARVEGIEFRCWYYSPSYVTKKMKPAFDRIGLEGLCTIVPPSYIDGFAEKHPRIYNFLRNKEDKYKGRWPWRVMGDYYIISFRKKEDQDR